MLRNYKLLPLFSSYQLKYHFFMEAFSQPVSLGKGPSVIFTHNIVSFLQSPILLPNHKFVSNNDLLACLSLDTRL